MKDTYSMKFRAAEGVIFRYKDGEGKTVLESVMADGSIAVSAWYTANEAPLVLSGRAEAGDAMMLVVRPYRLELYGNGALLDEEWPYGEPLFAGMVPEEDAVLLCDAPAEEETPSFAGSFTGAEGWYPGGGVFVGDCMPYADGERYHVLYLKDRHRHRSKWQKGAHQWAHISTTDLIHWDIHPMAVEIDDPMEGSICTGSWIRNGGLHRLYYTVRMSDGSSAPIRRSLSEDGWHYRKDRSFGFCQ